MADDQTPGTALVIDSVTYDVVQGPPADSKEVEVARAKVLQNLDLGHLLVDLQRTNDLLHVAACGVAGSRNTTLSGKVAGLQYKLLTACSDAIGAMGSFKDSAGNVLNRLRMGLRFLYTNPPREDRVMTLLAACESDAKEMAETAGQLAGGFKALADDAEATLESTLDARDMEEQERLAAIRRRDELKAADAKAQALKKSLVEQMEKVQKLVDEAREAQNKAEDRAFGLAILGNITSAIGAGVATFASIKAAPLTAASTLAAGVGEALKPKAAEAAGAAATALKPTPGVAGEPDVPKTGLRPKPVPAAKPAATAEKDGASGAAAAKAEGAAAATAPKPKEATPAGDKPKEAVAGSAKPVEKGTDKPVDKPATAAGATPKAAAQPASAGTAAGTSAAMPKGGTEEERRNAAAIAAAVAQGSAQAAQGNQQMASNYGAIAERYAAEKRAYLDLLMDLQAQQRGALGSIAEYAQQMKNADMAEEGARSAVASLQQAVAALKQIVTVLETTKLFWEMMAKACKRLASNQIRTYIDMFKDDPAEDRLAEYTRTDFKRPLLEMAAGWYALKSIAEEYEAGVALARADVAKTIEKAPSIEEARKLAPQLADKLQLDVDKDLVALDAATAKLKAEQALLPGPAAPAAAPASQPVAA